MNPYFTVNDSEHFTFYRIPKLLFTDEIYQTVSTDAKMLYGLLLDRLSLSEKRVIFTTRKRERRSTMNNKNTVPMKPALLRIEQLRPFEGHPYKVQDNEEMAALSESIRENGVLSPLIVRSVENCPIRESLVDKLATSPGMIFPIQTAAGRFSAIFA